ncbi:zinc finger protein ubi-d4 [Topomyia yanbarensis]|uniref:zinc finger protein ubi-d4 n=1 Tax=Topomyia yanbarensis TaxID=2498891 RepID=UPI00273ADEE6|nr:zinc finger protein ubi-d4 [Topomyia yanbarensis]
MASSGGVDIQIVSMPNLQKIESYMRDSTYRETLEVSASFNTRLCLERRMRIPFFDSQTGVAQKHSNLYMAHCRRMPGHREGQLYTYPATRWRKSKRQYLTKLQNLRPFSSLKTSGTSSLLAGASLPPVVREPGELLAPVEPDFNASLLEETSLGATVDTDSKDSHQNLPPTVKEEPLPKDWYYDEMALNDDDLDDPEGGDSDYDYNVNGYKRKGKRSKRSSHGGKKGRSSQALAPVTDYEGAASPGGSSRKGRPPGGGSSGTKRGRKKTPKETVSSLEKQLEDSLNNSLAEPPSFETAAAAVDMGENGENGAGYGGSADLRNYRKYL